MLAVFDSGLGGLSILHSIRKVYQGEVIYLGDTSRAPYGNRSDSEITSFTKELLFFTKECGATHFVGACNSISMQMTETILESVGIKNNEYTDMVRATKEYCDPSDISSLLILATAATIRSEIYDDVFSNVHFVESLALPLLAGAIERGDDDDIATALAPLYYDITIPSHIFLGCTHFPFLKDKMQKLFSEACFVDPAIFVKQKVREWNLPEELHNNKTTYFLSKESEIFKRKVFELGLDQNAEFVRESFVY